ncbi:conserved protein of unknown function [uncultured Woeseiaceae bacterium]|uniref:Schlafen group 3-like DNA/RNA helicase domain-containing protein n=1 Tax=uncultured Woeseiaceae bacterium TaxID=1983305 RepID=A0A7D9H490_9GAMM|nr:conserved protein of unknown function [uncultured Woeseiaceae bacterium]
MKRSYYSASVNQFLQDSDDAVLGALTARHPHELEFRQRNAWIDQIQLFRQLLQAAPGFSGHLFFEFSIPRMGKRADVVLVHAGIVFVLEFKVGERHYTKYALDQALDYGLDLKNFHSGSHDKTIVPMVVATRAPAESVALEDLGDRLYAPLRANSDNLLDVITAVVSQVKEPEFDSAAWEAAGYRPTPTIIEAAQALYRNHDVEAISRSDAGAINLTKTTQAIDSVIDSVKETDRKAICFVTGVPGSGKTLAGLNIAIERQDAHKDEHAVFLSGNGPLVKVLREALVRDKVAAAEEQGIKITKKSVRTKAQEFIQPIHHFRDEALKDPNPQPERVVVFDEAQRAWTKHKAVSFMRGRDKNSDFDMSEPEFLVSVMDRHEGYAVIVCLIGGGQEINTGEAGLPEWFDALANKYPDWDVYVSGQLEAYEYNRGEDLYAKLERSRLTVLNDLHLAVSLRSYRAEVVSDCIKVILDRNEDEAREYITMLQDRYPIVLTRSLDTARNWLRQRARGTERFGIVASSGAHRLKPLGLNLKAEIDPVNWFLENDEDVRSSYYLEDVATEFDIQGLELDWVCVAWDGNFRWGADDWIYQKFKGTKWQNINKEEDRLFLKNAYRVLLTRARQGMVLFIPEGSDEDPTRSPEYYDGTCEYLAGLGIKTL